MCMAVSWMQAKPSIELTMLFSLRTSSAKLSTSCHQISSLLVYLSTVKSIRWSNKFSEPFNTSNEVCQGGVLSPILFKICIDNLLSALECNGVGCFWKHHFVGAV